MDGKKLNINRKGLVTNMFIKIIRLLIKAEKWILDKFIHNKDTLEYEDYFYTIKNHEKQIERIYRESKM